MTIEHLTKLSTQTKAYANKMIDLGDTDAVDWSADIQHLIKKEITRKQVLNSAAYLAHQPAIRSAT